MVVGMQVVIATTSGVELATGTISIVLGCEAITVVGALLGPTMMNDPVLVARWMVIVVVVVLKIWVTLAAAELVPGRVAVTVASSVVEITLVIVVVSLVTTLDAPAAIEDEGVSVETGTGTMVSVMGATDELETTAAAELEEDGVTEAAAELDDETIPAAEVELVAPAGQFVTSGPQEVIVTSSTEV